MDEARIDLLVDIVLELTQDIINGLTSLEEAREVLVDLYVK